MTSVATIRLLYQIATAEARWTWPLPMSTVLHTPTFTVHDFIYPSHRLEASNSDFQFTTLSRFRQSTRCVKSII